MKYDVVIIGGGLSALTCGIRLADAGRRTLIVSSGQSSLHFSTGSFDLLSTLADGSEVVNPVDAVRNITDASHPYAKLKGAFATLAAKASDMLSECGIKVDGNAARNHFRLSPIGTMCPTWLTLDGMVSSENSTLPFKKIAIVNASGFLDFYPEFIADALKDSGVECDIHTFSSPALEDLRESPTEMRSANIARAFDSDETRVALVQKIREIGPTCDAVLIPAVAGLESDDAMEYIRTNSGMQNVYTAATMPPSVPGIRVQKQLRRQFEKRGGRYMLGDTAVSYDMAEGRIKAIYTENHRREPIEATEFVLATGSFFSSGLEASSTAMCERLFGCDVAYPESRDEWYDRDLYATQPFEKAGVRTDDEFRAYKDGAVIENLHAIGSVLEGADPVGEGCREGVDMLTALAVAEKIIGKA